MRRLTVLWSIRNGAPGGREGADNGFFFRSQPMEWRALRHVTELSDGSSRRRAEIASSVGLVVLWPWQGKAKRMENLCPGFQVPSNNKDWKDRFKPKRGTPLGEGSIAQTAPNPANPVPMNRGWVHRWKLDSGWICTGPVPMMVEAGCWMACENSNARQSWGLLQNVREKALTDDSGGPTLYKVRTTVPCPAHRTHFMSICPSFEEGEEAWRRAAEKMTSASGI